MGAVHCRGRSSWPRVGNSCGFQFFLRFEIPALQLWPSNGDGTEITSCSLASGVDIIVS